jgi:cyclopropane-fatty-acyl-phospholipid synthase
MWDRLLDSMLAALIRRGTLTLFMPDGTRRVHGDRGDPQVTVRIHDPALVPRLVRTPELAMGEGYMDGTLSIDGDDLHALFAVLLGNWGDGHAHWWMRLNERLRTLLRRAQQWNPAPRSRANVAHHYDLSGALYALFLDPDRQYSCAYFRDPAMTLEEAQAAKKAHIAAKLRLAPGQHVLDIGCGWGGMAITLARDHGVRVTGITLSEEQLKVATERAAAAGLSDRVSFRLTDYRDVRGRFDRVVSVGMFEHVGVPHYRTYFDAVAALLDTGGVALIHTIGRAARPGSTSPWITRYIFPGGYVPALSEVMPAVEAAGLWPADIEVWRLHYAETLRHWQQRFQANRDKVRALHDERFCRMWMYYLVASEMTFRAGRQCVFQLQLARDQQAVPLTRDYLYPADRHALRAAAE